MGILTRIFPSPTRTQFFISIFIFPGWASIILVAYKNYVSYLEIFLEIFATMLKKERHQDSSSRQTKNITQHSMTPHETRGREMMREVFCAKIWRYTRNIGYFSNLLRQNSHHSVKKCPIAMKLSENTCNKNKLKVIENLVKIFTSSVFIFDFSEGRVNLPCAGHDRVKEFLHRGE